MKVATITQYVGPSIFTRVPAVRFSLTDDDERALATTVNKSVFGHLDELLPGLAEHCDACNVPEIQHHPAAGQIVLNHLFEHVCIELQNLAGGDLNCARSNSRAEIPLDEAVVPFEEESVCIEAARLAGELLGGVLRNDSLIPNSRAPKAHFESRIAELITLAEKRMLPIQDRALVKAARARSVPVNRLTGRVIQLGQGRYQQRICGTKTTLTNVVSNDLAANKDYARRLLGSLGLPVPRYERVSRRSEAVAAAERIGFPVVVKPNKGNMGRAVSVGMKNRREVRAAYERAREFGRSVLVEELVQGFDYRMLVVNGELLAASKRVPGHVCGDGERTIEELVEQTNKDPRRGSGQKHSWTRIKLDDQADRLLSELGYTHQSVPKDGETVYLRRNANTSDGGTAVDVTDDVHPDNREIAVRTARSIGLDIAGVDLLTEDISTSLWKFGGSICEVNSKPGLRKHIWPAEGKPRDVMTPIVDMLFPPGKRSRVPVIAVTGSQRLSTGMTARMLARILEVAGRCVGLAVDSRVHIAGRAVRSAPLCGAAATKMILADPDVDIAIVETPVDDLLEHGLGCDSLDVCVAVIDSNRVGDAGMSAKVDDALRLCASITRETVLVAGDGEWAVSAVASDDVEVVRVSTCDAISPVPTQLAGPESDAFVQSECFANAAARLFGAEREDIERGIASFRARPAAKAQDRAVAQV